MRDINNDAPIGVGSQLATTLSENKECVCEVHTRYLPGVRDWSG